MKYELISKICNQTGNYWDFTKIVIISGKKIKVKIKRDAYDEQSYAKVELWSNDKWNHVYNVPIVKCHSKNISYVQDKIDESLFEKDFEDLLNIAIKIIC